MEGWKKTQEIRAYAEALEKTATELRGKVDPASDIGKWISWIREYAGKVDPFRGLKAGS
jgi:hypothetical protein